MASCLVTALINNLGVNTGLYDASHTFRDAQDEYSIGRMYIFSFTLNNLAAACAVLFLYLVKAIRTLAHSCMRLLGIQQYDKNIKNDLFSKGDTQ